MNNDQIQEIALANGFKLKEQPDGSMGLNPYVFEFVRALLKATSETEPVAYVSDYVHTGVDWMKSDVPNGTALFTHPANDGLEQAEKERDELLKALRDMAEQIKRCDYTQARSGALKILARYQEGKS